MKLSVLIAKLRDKMTEHGDVEVYNLDMGEVNIEVCDNGELEDADSPTFGETYLCIG